MKVTRRGFIKLAAAGATGAAVASSAKDVLAIEEFTGYPERYGMLTDVSLCIGCRSCEAGCNAQNELPAPEVPFEDLSVLDKKRRPTSRAYTVVNRYDIEGLDRPVFRKTQCNHCNEPACISACFVKALKKTKEGPVLWDSSLCVGCRYCLVACPFYIPAYEYEEPLVPRIMKCTMCFNKITTEGGAPACAESCPTEAITFGKLTDLLHVARERIRREPDRYVDHIYGEFEVGGTSWLYLSHVPFDEIGLPTDLGTTPYPKYTKSALGWIPMIVVLWPVMLGGLYALARRRDAMDRKAREEAVAKAVEETREAVEKKAETQTAVALSRAKAEAEKEKKAAVEEAVRGALEAARGESAGEDDER